MNKFYEFLDNIGFGTGILIVIGLGTLAITVYKMYKQFKADSIQRATDQLKAIEAGENLKKSMDDISKSISELNSKISEVDSKVEAFDRKYIDNINKIQNDMSIISETLENNTQESMNADAVLDNKLNEYNRNIEKVSGSLSKLEAQTNRLIESDRENIKAYIANVHKASTNDGYIDFHILSIVETQYATYLEENGNTFIEKLMCEIRELPTEKPGKKTTKRSTSTTTKTTTRKKSPSKSEK